MKTVTISIDTLKAIVAAFNSSSQDTTRHNITGVLLRPEGDNLFIVSTDGHIMMRDKRTEPELCAAMGKDYFVHNSQCKFLKNLIKEAKFRTGIDCHVDENEQVVKFSTLDNSFSTDVKSCDRQSITFPDYESVFKPTYDRESETVIGLNPELLVKLFEAMKLEKHTKGVKLKIKGPKEPIVVEVEGKQGLIMPMRI